MSRCSTRWEYRLRSSATVPASSWSCPSFHRRLRDVSRVALCRVNEARRPRRWLPLTAPARFASFGKQCDARDHLFVQDPHLPPRFFAARPHLFADGSKLCADVDYAASPVGQRAAYFGHVALQLRDIASQLRDIATKLRDITSKLRHIASKQRDIATQCGKVSADGGYLLG